MPSFSAVTIGADRQCPFVLVRRFENGDVQIYQASQYQGRHGKTIYLTNEQYKALRLHLVEELD